MVLALTGRSASSTGIRGLKTTASFALLLTDVCKGFGSLCFVLGLQRSFPHLDECLGPHSVPCNRIWMYGGQCSLVRGSVCMECWETPVLEPSVAMRNACHRPSWNQGWGSSLELLLAVQCFPQDISGKIYPPPLPPFIKRSQISAVAITVCLQGAAPASSFLATLMGGKFKSLPLELLITVGKSSTKPGAWGWWGLVSQAGKHLLGCCSKREKKKDWANWQGLSQQKSQASAEKSSWETQ